MTIRKWILTIMKGGWWFDTNTIYSMYERYCAATSKKSPNRQQLERILRQLHAAGQLEHKKYEHGDKSLNMWKKEQS